MATKKIKKSKLTILEFGALPVASIYATMEIDLDSGTVVMSKAAQRHAAKRHPKDYGRCMPHAAQIIRDPLYMGDDFKNPGNIEFVGRIPAVGESILIAICIEPDDQGRYNVCSIYPIAEATVQARLKKNRLSISKKARASLAS